MFYTLYYYFYYFVKNNNLLKQTKSFKKETSTQASNVCVVIGPYVVSGRY
jgi:hypothetical protein